jgi:alpha-L-rhamnosidase
MNPTSAKMIWNDKTGKGRNIFCLFLRRFKLDSVPSSTTLHLFADSLYRLRVNGHIVGYGPARFTLTHPEFDSYDLTPWLQVGDNNILVEANSRGALCYQGLLSRGGFIAWGETSSGRAAIDFSTPGDWECAPTKAWEQVSEPFSFAQGPIEVLDQTLLPKGYPAFLSETKATEWQKPVEVSSPEHWGKLAPRSIPMPTLEPLAPTEIVMAAKLKGGLVRYGFNAANEDGRGIRQPFFTHIYSDKAQDVELGVFWGPTFINGTELKGTNCQKRGNRQNAVASLRAGWNFVYGMPELLQPSWTWLMDHPDLPGLKFRALPDDTCQSAFALGAASRKPLTELTASIPSSLKEVVGYPQDWKMASTDRKPISPSREVAWDQVGEVVLKNSPPLKEIELLAEGEGVTVVFDTACEYLGHISVEFETEKGGIVDVGYEEMLWEDGTFKYYKRNPFVNTTERYVVSPGAGRIDTFHERGGRYIQVTFRGAAGKVRIKNLSVVQTTAKHEIVGTFKCEDSVLNWTWKAGQLTLIAGFADGWVDSPWRERGMYIGDVLVEAAATRKLIPDRSVEAWAIRVYAHSQMTNGQIRDVAPSNRESALFDYTLIWVQLLRNYWAATGDVEIIREVWPVIGRVMASSIWKADKNDLWAVEGEGHIFVSWGKHDEERLGVNAVLNAFRIRALDCISEMAGVIGLSAEKESYAKQSQAVRAAFRRVFWDETGKRFVANTIDGKRSTGPSVHANTLALAYEIGDATQEPGVIAYLESELKKNIDSKPGHLDLYFLSYLWTALYRVGKAGLAENLIREHYGFMRDRGAWTLWETLGRGSEGQGSTCHGWSASPVIVFSERVLGVQELVPGDPSQILVAPESDTLDSAEGTVPNPLGLIEVSWRIEGSNLNLSLKTPKGVHAEVKPAGRLAKLKLVRS